MGNPQPRPFKMGKAQRLSKTLYTWGKVMYVRSE